MAILSTRSTRTVAWLFVCAWTTVIVTLSLVSLDRLGDVDLQGWDRAIHAGFYAVFAILLVRALALSGTDVATAEIGTFFAALALGGAVEGAQASVGRSPEVLDWLADGAGALIALAARATWNAARERSR